MLDVVGREDYALRRADLQKMHRLRARVFRDRMGWDVAVRDGLERDRFDDLDPDYLLCFNAAGKLVGTWRMLPTTGPYMLRDVFPDLLEGRPPPNDPRIWEGSRFAVEGSAFERASLGSVNRATAEIFCGLVEYCLARDIAEVVTVYDIRIARLLPRIGCRSKWLSRPKRIGNTITLTGRFDISAEVLDDIRKAVGIRRSVVRHAPWMQPQRAA